MSPEKRMRRELARKLLHILGLTTIVAYSVFRFLWSEQVAMLALTGLLLLLLQLEYIRLEVKPKILGKILRMLKLLRRKEHHHAAGNVFFTIGAIICFAVFDYSIAVVALCFAVFGDLVSALVGIRWGRHSIFKKKTWEGTIAGLIANLCIGYLFMPAWPQVFIGMALVASIVEVITNKLDDNLTVPLFAGFTGQMLVYFFGIYLIDFPGPFGWLFAAL